MRKKPRDEKKLYDVIQTAMEFLDKIYQIAPDLASKAARLIAAGKRADAVRLFRGYHINNGATAETYIRTIEIAWAVYSRLPPGLFAEAACERTVSGSQTIH